MWLAKVRINRGVEGAALFWVQALVRIEQGFVELVASVQIARILTRMVQIGFQDERLCCARYQQVGLGAHGLS